MEEDYDFNEIGTTATVTNNNPQISEKEIVASCKNNLLETNNQTEKNGSDKEIVEIPPLPKGTQPLNHQLAGHKYGHKDNKDMYGMLACDDGYILKPVALRKGRREQHFYELVNKIFTKNEYFSSSLYDSQLIAQLKPFIPTFHSIVYVPEHPHVPYIKMVDITKQFHKPHIMDIKIGKQAWAPGTEQDKIQRQRNRCPHIDEICFQVLGARYFDAHTGALVTKLNLRSMNPDDLIQKGLKDVFEGLLPDTRQVIIKSIVTQLQQIEMWFKNQHKLAFYGSSVLIVFEADASYHSPSPEQLEKQAQVRMIDFVHVFETEDEDKNYIEGIENLQKYLRIILEL